MAALCASTLSSIPPSLAPAERRVSGSSHRLGPTLQPHADSRADADSGAFYQASFLYGVLDCLDNIISAIKLTFEACSQPESKIGRSLNSMEYQDQLPCGPPFLSAMLQ